MFFIYFLEYALIAFVALTAITQVILPTFTGGRMFPSFRRAEIHDKYVQAQEEIARLREQIETDELNKELNRLRQQHEQHNNVNKESKE